MPPNASKLKATKKTLDKLTIVVTRPKHQADNLCKLIENLGGLVIRLPVIEIIGPQDVGLLQTIIERLDEYDLAIFVSANAVDRAYPLITSQRAWPPRLKLAAVGRRTAESLNNLGMTVDLFPQHKASSEALLELDALKNVSGKNIIIFRGQGGREELANSLHQRGANVDYAEVYQRIRPNPDINPVEQAGQQGDIGIIIVTSNEGLRNLYEILGEKNKSWLTNIPLAVISSRTAELAKQLAFKQASIIAKDTSDQGLVQGIEQWYADRQGMGSAKNDR